MRQFGLRQHLPEPAPPYRINLQVPGEYQTAIETWNHRHLHTQQQREFILSDEEYYTWYWQITRRYIIRSVQPLGHVVEPYTPRAPLERNVADGVYRAIEMVDELSHEVSERSKGKCFNIKRILQSILGKNKLARPAPPPPPPPPQALAHVGASEVHEVRDIPPPETTRVYTSRRKKVASKGRGKGKEAEPSQPTQVMHGPSQPQEGSSSSSHEDVPPKPKKKQRETPYQQRILK